MSVAPIRTEAEKAEIEAKIEALIKALAMADVARHAGDAEALAKWNAEAANLATWLQNHAPEVGVDFLQKYVIDWCGGPGSEFSVCDGVEEVHAKK